MKSLFTNFLVFLLLYSVGLSQSFSNKNAIATTDSLPVIYIPGIMGSPLYNDINDDDKLEDLEKAWIAIPPLQFLSLRLD